jgi:hypothetical protein
MWALKSSRDSRSHKNRTSLVLGASCITSLPRTVSTRVETPKRCSMLISTKTPTLQFSSKFQEWAPTASISYCGCYKCLLRTGRLLSNAYSISGSSRTARPFRAPCSLIRTHSCSQISLIIQRSTRNWTLKNLFHSSSHLIIFRICNAWQVRLRRTWWYLTPIRTSTAVTSPISSRFIWCLVTLVFTKLEITQFLQSLVAVDRAGFKEWDPLSLICWVVT